MIVFEKWLETGLGVFCHIEQVDLTMFGKGWKENIELENKMHIHAVTKTK